MNTSNAPNNWNDGMIGSVLFATADLHPSGIIVAPNGTILHVISLETDLIKKGQRVIVIRSIEGVGYEVELYLDESEWSHETIL